MILGVHRVVDSATIEKLHINRRNYDPFYNNFNNLTNILLTIMVADGTNGSSNLTIFLSFGRF